MLIAQKLFGKVPFINAQVAFVNVSLAQAGEALQMINHVLALLWGQAVAFGKRVGVRASGPLLDIRPQLVKVLLIFGAQFLVVPSCARVSREKEHEREIIAWSTVRRLEIQDAGDQHDAVERESVFHQVAGKSGGTRGAIAFSHHEEWR